MKISNNLSFKEKLYKKYKDLIRIIKTKTIISWSIHHKIDFMF
jgi:hypothetical protein